MNVAVLPTETRVGRPAIRRDFDAQAVNRVLNDPAVRADVADVSEGVIDLSERVADVNNVLLMGEHGGVFAIAILPGVYELHTQILPSGRGPWAFAFAREVTRWMFTHTNAYELMTRIPHTHMGARILATRSGMKYEFSRKAGCRWRGEVMSADIFSLRIQDWAVSAPNLEEVGHDFHDKLNAKAAALGVTEPPHDDDPVHNRYLGAALEMVRHGQVRKGVEFYDRWAIEARHSLAAFISDDPPTIRFDLGIMTFRNDGDFEVTRC